jgi:hypothetical protein
MLARCFSMLTLWLGLLASSSAMSAEEPVSVERVIKAEGSYAFTDGSSVFRFFKNGAFSLAPLGMSGRTVEGSWLIKDRAFVITGNWSWINGLTALNDYRRMKLYVIPLPGAPSELDSHGKVYPAYVLVDELVSVPAPHRP